jgi:hypothetical protein
VEAGSSGWARRPYWLKLKPLRLLSSVQAANPARSLSELRLRLRWQRRSQSSR